MTLQIIITAYILVFLGIIYLTWNHFFNSPEDISHTMEKDTKADSEIENGFEGKKVVFDGELDAYIEENIKNELRNKHAIVEDKMAEDTNFLITGKNPDWLVVEEAKDLGVTIFNEMDWQNTVHKIETNLSAETKLLREGNEVDSAEIV